MVFVLDYLACTFAPKIKQRKNLYSLHLKMRTIIASRDR